MQLVLPSNSNHSNPRFRGLQLCYGIESRIVSCRGPNHALHSVLLKKAAFYRHSLAPKCERHVSRFSRAIRTGAELSGHGSGLGRREAHTLELLEWSTLCQYIAKFASTSIGREKLLELKPERSQEEVEAAQAATVAADLIEGRYAATLDFGGISTAQAKKAVSRAGKGGALTATQLLAVAGLSTGAVRLQRTIKGVARQWGEEKPESQLRPLLAAVRGVEENKAMCQAITFAINDSGQVKDSASDSVSRTRSRVQTIQNRLKSVLKGMSGEISEQGNRICLSVPAGEAPKGAILLGSSPGRGFQYIEPQAAVALNNELAAARGEMYAAEEEVLWKLSGLVMEAVDSLQISLEMVIEVDTLVAKARFGRWMDGCYPDFGAFPRNVTTSKQKARAKTLDALTDTPWIRLRRLRHPLLLAEWLKMSTTAQAGSSPPPPNTSIASKKKQANAKLRGRPVPTDIGVRQEVRSVIITGPNTGGKTAALKATGLAVLMAKSGLSVPASSPVVLPPFSNVLADIGDSQSLQSSLSTFSGHLLRTKEIRKEADGKSLILLDELGTGTEPGQGAALGVAILKALVKGGMRGASFTMASTHHSSLTSLKYEDSRFENASVEFDEEKLRPTFRLLWGIPGRSNAINTAARLGLNPNIIEAARQRLGVNLNKMDSTIQKLEALRNRRQEDEDRTETMSGQAAQLESQVSTLRRSSSEREATSQLESANLVIRLVDQAKARLERLQNQKLLQGKRRAEEQAEEAKRRLKEEEQSKKLKYEKQNPLKPTIGQDVRLPKLQGKGKVLAINGDQATVQMGRLKVNVRVSELTRI